MAKNRAPSKNSRAARRETGPSLSKDQSPQDVKPDSSSGPQRPSVLAAHHAAGVQKKTKRKSQMSSKARKRHERGMQMAEAITERTGKKIERSISRGRNVSRRAKGWDEINKEAEASGVKLVDVEGAEPEGDKDWETDEDMAADAPAAPATAGAEAEKPVDDNGYIAIDEDEEIL